MLWQNGNLRYLCLPSFVPRQLLYTTHMSDSYATHHLVVSELHCSSAASETGLSFSAAPQFWHLCLFQIFWYCGATRTPSSLYLFLLSALPLHPHSHSIFFGSWIKKRKGFFRMHGIRESSSGNFITLFIAKNWNIYETLLFVLSCF